MTTSDKNPVPTRKGGRRQRPKVVRPPSRVTRIERKPVKDGRPERTVVRGANGGRTRLTAVRWTDGEYGKLVLAVEASGLSLGAFIRAQSIGDPGEGARRPPHVHAQALAEATAALNRLGNLLNQIARAVNMATPYDQRKSMALWPRVGEAIAAMVAAANGESAA